MERKLFDLTIGKGHELLLALQNADFTAKQAEKIIKDPEYAKMWVDQLSEDIDIVDQLAKYANLLSPIARQALNLRELNNQVPVEFQISDSKFDNVDTNSDHVQRYDDLEFLFISLGDFKKTQKLIREQTKIAYGIRLSKRFKEDEDKFQLHEAAASFFYEETGVYRLRINLAANWEPVNNHSVDQLWANDLKSGKKLNAGSLGDAALNVQDRRLRCLQNGTHLPYHDHTDIVRSGDGHRRVPYSLFSSDGREVYFGSSDSDYNGKFYSAPALVKQC
jgi:hypothetical protein